MMEDPELEKIKARKLHELLSKSSQSGEVSKAVSYPSEPIEISDENFDEVVSRYPLVVVDFWAEWCAPCRMMNPVIKELAKELAGKVVFAKLNVDENPSVTARYGVMSIPTFIIFKNGRPVDIVVGAGPKSVLLNRIQRYAA